MSVDTRTQKKDGGGGLASRAAGPSQRRARVLVGSGLTSPDHVVLHLIHAQPQVRVLDVGRQVAVANRKAAPLTI